MLALAYALLLGEPATEPDPADHTVVTDRPDFANSSITVPRGGLQVEVGVNADVTPKGSRGFPLGIPTAVRFGVTRHLELRFFDGESAEWLDHVGTLEVREAFGAKWRLVDEDVKSWRPAIALQPLLHIGFNRNVRPVAELTLIVTQPFGELVMLDMNFGGEYEAGSPRHRAFGGFLAGSVGVQVHRDVLLYTELYISGTTNVARSLRWGGDGGFVVSLTPRFAVDLAARLERYGRRPGAAMLGGLTALLFRPCHPTATSRRRPLCRQKPLG